MTKRTNLFPSLRKSCEINFLKIAGTSFLLLCVAPQFSVADNNEKHTVATTQQVKVETATGVVKDQSGETVIGASVVVKGTSNGTITGMNGEFTLKNVKKGDIIHISFVGYKPMEVKYEGVAINVTLQDDAQALEEVVVTALGFST